MRWRELRYETIYYVPSLSVERATFADRELDRTGIYPFSIDWDSLDLSRKYTLAAEEKTNAQLHDEGTFSIAVFFTSILNCSFLRFLVLYF